jgi:P27 family predicted phage terminase small subunit
MEKKLRHRKRIVPSAPPHLSTEAKTWWRKINEGNEINDQAGLIILTTALEAFDRMRQAQAIIAELVITVSDRWQQVKPNPAAAIEHNSRAAMLSALRQLNLDIEPTTQKGQ